MNPKPGKAQVWEGPSGADWHILCVYRQDEKRVMLRREDGSEQRNISADTLHRDYTFSQLEVEL